MTTQKTVKTQHTKLILTAAIAVALFASMPAQAREKGDILVRARVININPSISDGNKLTDSNTGEPAPAGAGVHINTHTTLDIDFTYMMTDNFGVELLLAAPTKHDIKATGTLSGTEVGDVHVLPPALIAQWHFMPKNNIHPYVGAGINYTFFYDEGTRSSLDNALGGNTSLSVDDTWGLVAQLGIDIDIDDTKGWYVNFDAKYIQMNTHAEIDVNGVRTVDANFDVNPLIVGIGIGTRF